MIILYECLITHLTLLTKKSNITSVLFISTIIRNMQCSKMTDKNKKAVRKVHPKTANINSEHELSKKCFKSATAKNRVSSVHLSPLLLIDDPAAVLQSWLDDHFKAYPIKSHQFPHAWVHHFDDDASNRTIWSFCSQGPPRKSKHLRSCQHLWRVTDWQDKDNRRRLFWICKIK